MDQKSPAAAPPRWQRALNIAAAGVIGAAFGIAGMTLLGLPADTATVAPVALPAQPAPAAPAENGTGSGTDSTPGSSDPVEPDAAAETAATEAAAAPGDAATEGDAPPAAASSGGGTIDQAAAEQAALAHLGAGQVTWVSQEDDYGAAWEIEVTLPNGSEVDVYVDAAGEVVHTS